MQKLSAKLSVGDPHGISEKGCAGRPPCSPPLISPPTLYLLQMWAVTCALIYLS